VAQGQAESGGMVLVAYAGLESPAAALRNIGIMSLYVDIYRYIVWQRYANCTHRPTFIRCWSIHPYCSPPSHPQSINQSTPNLSHSPTCDVPFPPRRTGRYRKGMISAHQSYQGVRRPVWDPETLAVPSAKGRGTSHGARRL
jgi:hypothetical protein